MSDNTVDTKPMSGHTPELLPCPFCGLPPEQTIGGRIKCANPACAIEVTTVRWNTDTATRDWNTRTPADVRELVEDMKQALEWALAMNTSPCRCIDFSTPPHICVAHKAIIRARELLARIDAGKGQNTQADRTGGPTT